MCPLRSLYRALPILAVLTILFSSSALPSASAQEPLPPSDFLDASFGGDGKVITDFGGFELGEGLALQTDGKIIVVGYSYQYDYLNQTHYDFALARYTTNGSLDTTFSGDGKITLDLGGQEEASAVALQPDGKIVVAGKSYKDTNYSFVLLRYNTNGTLDTTFSGDGKVVTDIIQGVAVAVQPDGKIVVAGSWSSAGNTGFSLARFNSNGSLDTTFDGDGKAVTYFSGGSASVITIVIQPNGRLLVTGYFYNGVSYDFALARYSSNGSLDATFSGDGKLTTDFGGDDFGADLVIQTDGKIVVAGTRGDPSGSVFNEFALARYHSNGVLDTTFDTDGKVTLRLGQGDYGSGIAMQPDGKLLVTGGTARSVNMNLTYDFALLRYNRDGSLDTTFDTDGKIILDFGSTYDPGDEIALQPDGKIILAGGTLNMHDDFAVARLSVDDRTMTISGNTGMAGVTLSYIDGRPKTVTSQTNGNYSFQVPRGWSGAITPSKSGYVFSPASRTYDSVLASQSAQNYTAIPLYSISGNVGAAGVTLSYIDGSLKTVTSQTDGSYSLRVPSNWSGTVTPVHSCFTFSPAYVSYTDLGGDLATQNYVPSLNAGAGCSDIRLRVGSMNQVRLGLASGEGTRASFPGVNNGPVRIMSANGVPLMGAERLIYKVNSVNTSFIEMMGLPNRQLDITYWLPWYNNVDLDTQLRLANASSAQAHVRVYIGDQEMVGSPFTLEPGVSTRQSFPGVNNGPVKIESDVPIVAAERVIYKVNGLNTSFSEMMAIPNNQLDTTYWLPGYTSVNLDTQLRFANVSDSTATVHVYRGWYEIPNSPFTLGTGQSTRVSLPTDGYGVIRIVSDVPVVASERVIYKVNGLNASFSEMMALPNNQLDTTYWLPWYNNVDLKTWVHFANATNSDSTATVHIFIGGTEVQGSPFYLQPRATTLEGFENINDGPVQIVSDVPLVVSEQVTYKVNGVDTSLSEMMALPNNQLDTIYWLPWYNNLDLDTQLRFGVP